MDTKNKVFEAIENKLKDKNIVWYGYDNDEHKIIAIWNKQSDFYFAKWSFGCPGCIENPERKFKRGGDCKSGNIFDEINNKSKEELNKWINDSIITCRLNPDLIYGSNFISYICTEYPNVALILHESGGCCFTSTECEEEINENATTKLFKACLNNIINKKESELPIVIFEIGAPQSCTLSTEFNGKTINLLEYFNLMILDNSKYITISFGDSPKTHIVFYRYDDEIEVCDFNERQYGKYRDILFDYKHRMIRIWNNTTLEENFGLEFRKFINKFDDAFIKLRENDTVIIEFKE